MTKKTVLIADDDQGVVQALTLRCKQLGVEVQSARDAAAALNLIHASPPDAILLDVNMPAGNGLSVCEMLTTDPKLAPIPVIMLTGRSDEETIRRCEALGAHYVLKSDDAWQHIEPILRQLLDLPARARSGLFDDSVPRPVTPKVLVIEDDADLSKALKIKLRSSGIEVKQAGNGMQGYWTALKEQPAIIITDYNMPEGNASFLLRRLKSHTLTRDIPVIVMTGGSLSGVSSIQKDFGLEREVLGLGATKFMTKPVDFEVLLNELHKQFAAVTA